MADGQDTTITAPAPAAVSTAVAPETPVVATPAVSTEAPASSEAVVANPTVSPAVTTATVPATETTIVPAKQPDAATSATGSPEAKIENPLGEDKSAVKKTDENPVEKVAELKTPEKVELPTYEEFNLPENVKLEGDTLNEFTKILGELETGKLDHKGYQDYGQKLIDFGTKAVTDSITRLNESYVQIHQNNQKARFEALKADAELGGDKLEGTISALQKSIAEYGGTETQIAEFRKEVTEAGLGASPAISRLIYNMQQKINKYTTEGNGNRIVPGAKPAPSKVKDYQKFYTA